MLIEGQYCRLHTFFELQPGCHVCRADTRPRWLLGYLRIGISEQLDPLTFPSPELRRLSLSPYRGLRPL